jgi:hypothetical protein
MTPTFFISVMSSHPKEKPATKPVYQTDRLQTASRDPREDLISFSVSRQSSDDSVALSGRR